VTLDARITGGLRYAQDQERPGILHARLLRSPVPHALVVSVDVSAVPAGVVTLTGLDVADLEPCYGPMIKDQPIVAADRVRYRGDVVAAVAAETERAAEEALAAITVDYEELPAVFEPEQAVAAGAPLVHRSTAAPAELRPLAATNVCHRFRLRSGQGEAGFAEAEVAVEETFSTAGAAHVPMEPHASLAWWEAGRLHVITGTQTPFGLRHSLAMLFHLPDEAVRVVVAPMGGSFGAKTFERLEPVVAALARKAGRPVRAVLPREEEFLTLNRHPARFRIRLGARRDGAFVAKRVEAWWDTGAYADCGPSVATKGGYAAIGPYRIPHVQVDSFCVYTNRPPNGAFRGYAATQAVWASERITDILAAELGIDPLELRLRNLLCDGDRWATGEVMHDVRFGDCLEAAARAVAWQRRGDNRGKGLMVMLKGMQTPSRTEAALEIGSEGKIAVRSATTDVGQRPGTTLRILAARSLGVNPDQVVIGPNDTDLVPFDTRTTSSRSTFMMSRALAEAAADLRRQVADRLEAAPADLVFGDGRVWVAGSPERGARLSDLSPLRGSGSYDTPGGLDPDTGQGVASSHWHQAAGAAQVDVDRETGVVSVSRLHTAVYAGRVVDGAGAELQTEGSTVMGLGSALLESIGFDGGEITNANLSDYQVPSFCDVPDFTYDLIEGGHDPHGLGEIAVPAVPAAIGNAVASLGIEVTRLPITAEDVLDLVSEP
jgi:CO/xanthine dehydrogenase Mo-binding subunit